MEKGYETRHKNEDKKGFFNKWDVVKFGFT